MSEDTELFEEIWVSGTYSSVFFSQQELRHFLDSLLNPDGSPPKSLNAAFAARKLIRPYTRREIQNASPNDLKEMLGIR